MPRRSRHQCVVFFFNDAATTEIYTLSLHDALPIWALNGTPMRARSPIRSSSLCLAGSDRKSTRLNSSHVAISYAVFCLKKNIEGDVERELPIGACALRYCFGDDTP